MPVTQPIFSSVAMPVSPAEADIHTLPREMVQEMLGYLDPRDLTDFESSQALRGLIGPDVFNRVARNFIEEREQTWPSEPWSSLAFVRCSASVREQFKGSDEEFARLYPHAVRLMGILSVCRELDRLSAEIQSRLSWRDVQILNPIIQGPVMISSTDEPAFLILDRTCTPSHVTPDGTISIPQELSNCHLLPGAVESFPIVNSMSSCGDGGKVVSRQQLSSRVDE